MFVWPGPAYGPTSREPPLSGTPRSEGLDALGRSCKWGGWGRRVAVVTEQASPSSGDDSNVVSRELPLEGVFKELPIRGVVVRRSDDQVGSRAMAPAVRR